MELDHRLSKVVKLHGGDHGEKNGGHKNGKMNSGESED